MPFTTSGQEMERVYSYNPGTCTEWVGYKKAKYVHASIYKLTALAAHLIIIIIIIITTTIFIVLSS